MPKSKSSQAHTKSSSELPFGKEFDQKSFERAIVTRTENISQREDGILIIEARPDIYYHLDDAVENMEAYSSFVKEVPVPAIVDLRKSSGITKEARHFYARASSARVLRAVGMIVDSSVTKIMANLFITFSRPPFPIRLFTSRRDALLWLEKNYISQLSPRLFNQEGKVIKTRVSRMWMGEDGIVRNVFDDGAVVTKSDFEELIQSHLKLGEGEKVLLLTDLTKAFRFERDARKYAAREGQRSVKKMALLSSSTINSAFGNFYIRFNRPSVQTRLFSSEEAAINWLKEGESQIAVSVGDEGEVCQIREVLGVMIAFAGQKYSVKAKALGKSDQLDALACCANMLGEELEAQHKELKSKQAQLVQTAKLASLGEMSSAVGHELNNPLCSVLGFTGQLKSLLQKENPEIYEKVADYILEITENGERMKKIVRHMREFSRKPSMYFEPISINKVIEKSFILFNEQLRLRSIRLEKDLCDEGCQVNGEEIRLEQVFVNLLSNACGVMEVDSSEEAPVVKVKSYLENDHVKIEFSDNGPGIEERHLDRIFEPFFTTKEVGEGTGLGLSISNEIIKEHNGTIQCSSEFGKGTVFTITLPKVPYTQTT